MPRSETPALTGRETVNVQEYSELREPIKTCEKCYSLIWEILKDNTTVPFSIFENNIVLIFDNFSPRRGIMSLSL